MVSKKSHDLPSAIWKPSKADGVIWKPDSQRGRFHFKSEGLRPRSAQRRRLTYQLEQSGRRNPTFSHLLFYSGCRLDDAHPPPPGRAVCSTEASNSNASLFWKCPHRHIQSQCLLRYLGILRHSQGDTLSILNWCPSRLKYLELGKCTVDCCGERVGLCCLPWVQIIDREVKGVRFVQVSQHMADAKTSFSRSCLWEKRVG